jgi:hypothetical protein
MKSDAVLDDLKRQDVLVVNYGHHYMFRKAQFVPHMKDFLSALKSLLLRRGEDAPTVIWRENSPQHFPTSSGAYDRHLFRKANTFGDSHGTPPTGYPCKSTDFESARSVNWWNDDIAELLEEVNIPVLKIWNITQAAPQMHAGIVGNAVSQRKGVYKWNIDCSHFCANVEDSIYKHWTHLLTAQFQAIKASGK